MEKKIIQKLRTILFNEINSECKVVYVLCESRKLLESYPPNPVPFTLKLYCHWALHVDLSHPNTTLRFLEQVDTYVADVLAGQTDVVQGDKMVREFVFLDTFRQEFTEFLRFYDLPTAVCDEDPRWHEFMKHYAGIIEDGSLSCQDKTRHLKLVSKVIFVRGRPAASSTYFPFDLSWEIVLLDGKTLTVNVNAASLPGGDHLISSDIHLH